MSGINMEALEKLMQAKKLEKEAFMMMLPESMAGHMEVISNEIKAMIIEVLSESLNKNKEKSTTDTNKNEEKSHVKKVDIG